MYNDTLVSCVRIFVIEEDNENDFCWFPVDYLARFLSALPNYGITSADRIPSLVSRSRMFCKDLKFIFFTECKRSHWYHFGLINMWCLDRQNENKHGEKPVIYFYDSLATTERTEYAKECAKTLCW